MNPIIRSILAVLLGSLITLVLVVGSQGISMVIFPLPEGFDPKDKEAMKALMPTMPLAAKLLVLAGYAVGTLAGSWFSAWFARRAPLVHAMIVGGIFLAGNIMNLIDIPHPLWMAVTSTLIFPVCAFVGAKLAGVPPKLPDASV